MSRFRLAAVSLVLCVTALACGDSGSPSAGSSGSTTPSTAPTGLTKAEWVTAVNKICLALEAETDKIAEPDNADEFASALKGLLAAFKNANSQVTALAPPAEDAAEIQAKFLTPNAEQTASLEASIPKVEAAAKTDDPQEAAKAFAEALEDSYGAEGEVEAQEKWMTDYGLTDCVG